MTFTIDTSEYPKAYLIDTEEKFNVFYDAISQQDRIAFDTEGTSLQAEENTIIGFSFAYDWWNGFYIPVKQKSLFGNIMDDFWENQSTILDQLLSILTNPQIEKSAHNAKYDIKVIKAEYGVDVPIAADSLIYSKLQHYTRSAKLAKLHKIFSDIAGYDDELNKIVSNMDEIDYSKIPLDILYTYGAYDALATYRLTVVLTQKLQKITGIDYTRL